MKKILLLAMMAIAVNAFNAFSAQTGALPGKFYVGNGKYVQFSKGNLQFDVKKRTYSFAENQYDVIGHDNSKVDKSSFGGVIDLFGFGTGDRPTLTSKDYSDYRVFVDWGEYPIVNGGNEADMWRTPTKEEWRYLLVDRKHAQDLFNYAKVNDVPGIVLLPDDWEKPEGCSFSSFNYMAWTWYPETVGGSWSFSKNPYENTPNIYSAEDWSKMESAGAVFLPCGGNHDYVFYGSPGEIWGLDWLGVYWSANTVDDYSGYALVFTNTNIYPTASDIDQYTRNSVRLLTDLDPDQHHHALPGLFSVSADKKVQFAPGNLKFHISSGTWLFADHQYDVVGEANINAVNDPSYVGMIDLFAWGTGDRPTTFSKEASFTTFVDWGTNEILNGGNRADIWRTLSHDEWVYLLTERPNADKLFGWGKINDKSGMIFLPDDWELPEGSSFTSPIETEQAWWNESFFGGCWESSALLYNLNQYTAGVGKEDTWSKMEAAGAVFFPCGGDFEFDDTSIYSVHRLGDYWMTTERDDWAAYTMTFLESILYLNANDRNRYSLLSVRLAKDEGVGDGIERIESAKRSSARKIMQEGRVLIEVNGKVYDSLGREVR